MLCRYLAAQNILKCFPLTRRFPLGGIHHHLLSFPSIFSAVGYRQTQVFNSSLCISSTGPNLVGIRASPSAPRYRSNRVLSNRGLFMWRAIPSAHPEFTLQAQIAAKQPSLYDCKYASLHIFGDFPKQQPPRDWLIVCLIHINDLLSSYTTGDTCSLQ